MFQKRDERILGNEDFVQSALSEAQEASKLKFSVAAQGISINQLIEAIAKDQGIQKGGTDRGKQGAQDRPGPCTDLLLGGSKTRSFDD